MVINLLKEGIKITDQKFDNALYSESIREVSLTNFTPIDIAIKAAKYLVKKPHVKVLDIGSGAGKFCIVGATCTDGHFTGIEQRLSLHQLAEQISKKQNLTNIDFIHANITSIDFSQYQAFYFFNSFYENLFTDDEIDDSVILKRELYRAYSTYVNQQLDLMPIGTRIVTYFSACYEIPKSYQVTSRFKVEKLVFWEKQT